MAWTEHVSHHARYYLEERRDSVEIVTVFKDRKRLISFHNKNDITVQAIKNFLPGKSITFYQYTSAWQYSMEMIKKGNHSKGGGKSKKVINEKTGEIFLSLKLAAKSIGMKAEKLQARLSGHTRNKTPFKYA